MAALLIPVIMSYGTLPSAFEVRIRSVVSTWGSELNRLEL